MPCPGPKDPKRPLFGPFLLNFPDQAQTGRSRPILADFSIESGPKSRGSPETAQRVFFGFLGPKLPNQKPCASTQKTKNRDFGEVLPRPWRPFKSSNLCSRRPSSAFASGENFSPKEPNSAEIRTLQNRDFGVFSDFGQNRPFWAFLLKPTLDPFPGLYVTRNHFQSI